MILTGAMLPVIGYYADRISSKFIVPLAFLTRCIAAMMFVTIQIPNTFLSYLSCSLLILATTVENVTIEVLFMRGMPGQVRGAMNGCLHFFGAIGILIFTKSGGYLFDHVAPCAPFALIGVCDFLLFMLATTLALLGYLK